MVSCLVHSVCTLAKFVCTRATTTRLPTSCTSTHSWKDRRLMKRARLRDVQRGRLVFTTVSDPGAANAGQLWMANITFVCTWQRFCYTAFVDAATRAIKCGRWRPACPPRICLCNHSIVLCGRLIWIYRCLLAGKLHPSPGDGALDTSSKHPSATACLMLSASFGQDRVRAESPPASRTSVKYAQRLEASEFHCTAVCPGPSFLTLTDTWQNRQSTDTRPEVR